ncbi:hypothetical protein KJ599_00870 [bacterium]|nr:hypothetical protein [bacterium]
MMMKPATRINEFCLDIVEFCENDPYLYKELLKERENFLSTTPEKYYKTLPQEILVRKEETFNLLEPITSELGIKLRRVKRLRMLEDAQASMFKFTAGENRDVI